MSEDPGADADWSEFFGFDEPYANQADAIRTAIEAGERRGYLMMEGPCGTGKTMAALTAGAHLVRHTDQYENVVVVTPVKQQLEQFIDDLRTMNRGLDDPLDGVALVGKADLCPYEREGVFPDDASVHDRCEDLREDTAHLVEAGDGGGGADQVLADGSAAVRTDDPDDEVWWDAGLAQQLVVEARRDPDDFSTLVDEPLVTAGVEAPYPRQQPTAPPEMAGDDAPLYCPFEADWYARDKGSAVGFGHGEDNVVTVDELLPTAVERGTCPHRAMSVLLEAADVVVGNYNHLFDPKTRPLTEAILDEQTFVVVDEAHRLEERVRDLLSDRLGRHTIKRARTDLGHLVAYARQHPQNKREIERRLGEYDVPFDAVQTAHDFYDDLVGWLDDRVEEYLATEFGDGAAVPHPDELPEHSLEIPLRDPDVEGPDELSQWAEAQGYDGSVWRTLATVGSAVEIVLEDVDEDRHPVCTAVGVVLGRWWEADHATFFREVELDHSPKDLGGTTTPWERVYTPSLMLYNCMPSKQLQEVFAGLGGGVLMSATLEPLDVFREVSGLDRLAAGDDDHDARPVVERSYDLPFPEENRASWIVDATAFTARNRGEPTLDNQGKTRDQYQHVLRTIARSHGNVMLCLPNYREASWAGAYLDGVVDKPVLVDESSSNEETERLKREFFGADEAVLVTSTRGTLTEGVDYDGDKLHACAVVGVPLVNIGSPRVRAVRQAYGDVFGEDNAFEYALTVPAVRRARQAFGRVIRSPEERGVRILVGNRYTKEAYRHSVFEYLSPDEQSEFVRMTPEFLKPQFERFWGE
ncbi:ATP-dependent DNA helicase [Halobacteriaceae archaeon GCM10025711]